MWDNAIHPVPEFSGFVETGDRLFKLGSSSFSWNAKPLIGLSLPLRGPFDLSINFWVVCLGMNVVRGVIVPWPGEVEGEYPEASGCDSLLIPHNYPRMMHRRNLHSLMYALYALQKPKVKPEPTSILLKEASTCSV